MFKCVNLIIIIIFNSKLILIHLINLLHHAPVKCDCIYISNHDMDFIFFCNRRIYKKLLFKIEQELFVDLLGFEPRQADPETAVLPLHHKSVE